jgi:hypothetical protein
MLCTVAMAFFNLMVCSSSTMGAAAAAGGSGFPFGLS